MTRWTGRVAAVVFVLALPRAAVPQEPLTLVRAVHEALAHNASLAASRLGADESAARVPEARGGYYPRISATESWRRGDEPVFVFSSLLSARGFTASSFAIDALNHPDPTGFFRASVGIEQVVFDGGRQRSLVGIASLRSDAASLAADEAAATLTLRTTETFGRVVAAEASRRAAEAGRLAAEEDLARAEHRRDAGTITDADVLALTVHAANLRQRAITAEGDAAAARAELDRLMGAPIGQTRGVAAPTTDSVDGLAAHPDLASLLAEAEAKRPELKRAHLAVAMAAETERAARAALVPQVAAQAAFDVAGTRIADRASSWIVGGEIRWTFSAGGSELADRRATRVAVSRARIEEDDARAAVHVEVVSAISRVDAARARAAVSRAAVDQARESQRIIRDRYDAGLTTVTEWLQASTSVLEADASRAAALVDTMVAEAALRRALGRTP